MKPRPRNICDYFGLQASFAPHEVDAAQSEPSGNSLPPDDASESTGSHERPLKKIRITAENGRDIAMRGLRGARKEEILTSSTAARHAGRRAKLGLLPSLPLDVLLEIFSHLAPLDILRLSRTTKGLRNLLLHRSSTYVWKAALDSVEGLPACPKELSLPFWTNLVFGHHCQGCLTSNVKKCDFILRVRYCNKCADIWLHPDSDFDENSTLDKVIRECIPFTSRSNRINTTYYHWRDKLKLLEDIGKVLESDDESAIYAFVTAKEAEVDSRLEHARECNKWMDKVIKDRENELNESRNLRADSIRAKLMDLGYQAELEFLDKLKAGDWDIYDRWPSFTRFEEHQLIKVPKPLTEKIWTTIKNDMVKYMAEISELRKENLRCISVRHRRSLFHAAYVNWRALPENLTEYPADAIVPNAADVLEFHQVQTLVNCNHEIELDMDLHVIPLLTQCLATEISNWRARLVCQLWVKIVDTRLWSEAEWDYPLNFQERLAQLEPAVVVFRCKKADSTHFYWEQKRIRTDIVFPAGTVNTEQAILDAMHAEQRAPVMWYPQFLHHQCVSMTRWRYCEKKAKMNECLHMAKEYPYYRYAPWDPTALEFDERASRTTKNILDACGMAWKTTTTKELDDRDPRLVCLKCSFGARCDGERRVRVWSWRDAVQHCLGAHFGDASVLWECLTPEDTTKARLLDEAECKKRRFLTTPRLRVWRCMKCRETNSDLGRMSWTSLRHHFTRNPSVSAFP
ncbi:hypothetical protein BDN70DRAFT_877441 [Pholiota conissans]|uniref:F-box domain-containing protein n=1 Tax=Pholiota conissans TaxID=109636 RepID=A0A9P5Z3T6_9AGAR|nr:hypothetical protein BDN70DRAFT_877441 [Pholiota conissans]